MNVALQYGTNSQSTIIPDALQFTSTRFSVYSYGFVTHQALCLWNSLDILFIKATRRKMSASTQGDFNLWLELLSIELLYELVECTVQLLMPIILVPTLKFTLYRSVDDFVKWGQKCTKVYGSILKNQLCDGRYSRQSYIWHFVIFFTHTHRGTLVSVKCLLPI